MITDNDTALTAEQVLQKYSNLIYNEVHRFIRYKGGDWDELLSRAHVAFVNAQRRYLAKGDRPDIGGGKWHMGGWIKFCVWNALLDHHRNDLKLNKRRVVETDLVNRSCFGGDAVADNAFALSNVPERRRFQLEDMIKEISADARRVVEIATTLNERGPVAKRHRLIEALQDLGWAGQRIVESFNEIREVMGL